MLRPIFVFFGVQPDIDLDIMVSRQSLANLTGLLFPPLDQALAELRPDLLIVQGDTTTAMVAAMVAYYNRIPVAHVEAGLRTNNNYSPFPEEINRRVISLIATLHFAPTNAAAGNLNGSDNVYVVGNTVVDSLKIALKQVGASPKYAERFASLVERNKPLVMVTAHRRESFGQGLANICEAIKTISLKYPHLQFLFPVHLNPAVREKVNLLLAEVSAVKLTDPLPYDQMVYSMSKTFLIMTDSGGIQEEAPFLGIPVIVMREVTERPEGVEAGCATLAGTSSGGIVRAFDKIYQSPVVYEAMKNAENPYGDGMAANRIASIIQDFL